MKLLIGIMGIFLLSSCACSDEDAARRTLLDAGYSDVRTTGWAMLGCGEDDSTSTGFVAKNPKGRRVEGVVCCGFWGKGCTIRH